jgi:hypothetical protein
VCGVNYIKKDPNDSSGAPLPSTPPLDPGGQLCTDFDNSIVFGAGLTQKPTCSADVSTNDPYLGYGAHTALADFTAGKFQLVIQTGAKNFGSGSGGSGSTTETGGKINTHAIDLAPPMSPARIDSWAAVVE